ncbi:hypothetical protein McpCs1_16230 [Methanocorpusculaceae archaeon Cs1]|uniref:Uncharacterized protein n=1 Tax=Methanorbis rubei TaxID=3028300 RepID=A0AAE4MHA7_9EURY|nr:hypothetical protein [Methanocorpusculaceae archaeon Cs1]
MCTLVVFWAYVGKYLQKTLKNHCWRCFICVIYAKLRSCEAVNTAEWYVITTLLAGEPSKP